VNLPQKTAPAGDSGLQRVYALFYISLASITANSTTDSADSVSRAKMSGTSDVITSQTVSFNDADSGEHVIFASAPSDQAVDQKSVALTGFLERPTLIQTVSWTEAAFAELIIDPWTLFLSNSYIKNKIQNFAFLRGNLKVKIVMNSAPFYYGAMLVSYGPTPNDILPLGTSSSRLVPLSQRPHMWVYPQLGTAGEVTLPFLLPYNYLDITSAPAVTFMGRLRFTEYAPLQSANGATTNGVTLQVYAWMENPEITGPTYHAALQSGSDEYGNGPVSAPAAAIGKFASHFHSIPIIGRFAKATTIGASAVSHIAKLFGWSNVPVIEDVRPFKNVPFHDIASAHISEPTAKFSLDPKAELSVDPSIVGGPTEDELAVSYLVQRESYLTQAQWATTDPIGTLYFSTKVNPNLVSVSGTTPGGTTTIYQTPLAWVGTLFANWQGDIIFRFKIVASKFHQGRLRISWDPVGLTNTSADMSNVLFTKIVDISDNDEVEFRVPYLQEFPWLINNKNPVSNNWSTTTDKIAGRAYDNGVLSVRCLTNLSAPVDVAPVQILVFVRGADNLEFVNPMELDDYAKCSHITMQSGDEPFTPSTQNPDRFLVNFADPVPSLRLLLRRSCKVDVLPIGRKVTTSDLSGNIIHYMTKFPPPPGYDPYGMFTAKGVEDPATTFQYNYSNMTYLEWISSAFVGMRGSVRWHYNIDCDGNGPFSNVEVRRLSNALIGAPDGPQYVTTYIGADSYSKQASRWALAGHEHNGGGGIIVNNMNVQPGISFEMPHMAASRFYHPNPNYYSRGVQGDQSFRDTYKVTISTRPSTRVNTPNTVLHRYCCAGTDFSLSFFLNVPPLYYNTGMGNTPV
jgi:hypothetical protein